MDAERKRQLKLQYEHRHSQMGIVGWQRGDDLWVAISRDARADENGTTFQLKLGSWPNKELQCAYSADPASCAWRVFEALEYEDGDVVDDDLELMLMEFMEAHPEARPMRPNRR